MNTIKKRYILHKILITLLIFYSCESIIIPLKIDYLKGSWKLSQDNYYLKQDSLLSLSSSTDLFSFFTIDKDNKVYSLNFSYSGNCTVDLQQIESKYHIKADTLQLYDMKDDFWYNLKIISLSENEMSLKNHYEDLFNGFDTVTFIKVQKSKPQIDYDKIIVQQYMYNLFSNCRKNIFYILNKNGTFQIANNGENKDEVSFLTYSIPKSQADSIFDNFQYVNFNDLSNEYVSGKSSEDLLFFKVFFLKNNKIIKSILDVDMSSLPEFYMSYLPITRIKVDKNEFINYTENPAFEKLIKNLIKKNPTQTFND